MYSIFWTTKDEWFDDVLHDKCNLTRKRLNIELAKHGITYGEEQFCMLDVYGRLSPDSAVGLHVYSTAKTEPVAKKTLMRRIDEFVTTKMLVTSFVGMSLFINVLIKFC